MSTRRYSAAAKKTQQSSGAKKTKELATKESETKGEAVLSPAKTTRTPASPISTHSGASPVKRPLSTSKGSSAKRKAKPDHAASSRGLEVKARRLEPDSDEDLFMLPQHERKHERKFASAVAVKGKQDGRGKAKASSAAEKTASNSKKRGQKSGGGQAETGQDTSDFETGNGENAGTKRSVTPAESLGHGGKRKSMPKAGQSLLSMFAQDKEMDLQLQRAQEIEERAAEEEAREKQEELVHFHAAGSRMARELAPSIPGKMSNACTQRTGKDKRAELMEKAAWLKDLTKRKSQRGKQNQQSDSESDDGEEEAVLQNCYFPAKMYLQDQLKAHNFDVIQFLHDEPAKATNQDRFDAMMMRESIGRDTLDAKEKKKVMKVVRGMLKEYSEYVLEPSEQSTEVAIAEG